MERLGGCLDGDNGRPALREHACHELACVRLVVHHDDLAAGEIGHPEIAAVGGLTAGVAEGGRRQRQRDATRGAAAWPFAARAHAASLKFDQVLDNG
jgi:hypothetical protein